MLIGIKKILRVTVMNSLKDSYMQFVFMEIKSQENLFGLLIAMFAMLNQIR